MIKYGEDEEAIRSYIDRLAELTESLNPLLVYVEQQDIDCSFRKAAEERPEEWLKFFIDYYTGQGYGRKHGLKGLEGTIEILKARQKLEKGIYNQLNINKAIIDNTSFNPCIYKERLKKIILQQLS